MGTVWNSASRVRWNGRVQLQSVRGFVGLGSLLNVELRK